MNQEFVKFPATPHLAVVGRYVIRKDKVMTEEERKKFLQHEIVVEEKIDGANLGISFNTAGELRLQNRGAYLSSPYSGQWKKLSEWLDQKLDKFFDILDDQYIVFGEWCYAQHSIFYKNLPDWFLGFDIYDKNNKKFLSYYHRNDLFKELGIASVPFISRGRFNLDDLKGLLLRKSDFTDELLEGLYLRFDSGEWLGGRAKLVRPEFIQAVEEHWARSGIKPNRLSSFGYI
jgi:ATP-dependent RNA circularization protein (DNA/RNA ligase family)